MPSYAENPDTGERLVLQGESWVPVQKAVNPTTGETLELFNDQWVSPIRRAQADTLPVAGAPPEGPPTTPPSDDVNMPQPGTAPPQNETMWQGVKRSVGDAVSGAFGDRVADVSMPDLIKGQPVGPTAPPANKSILAPAKAALAQQGLGMAELAHASLQTSFDTLLKGSILIGKANAKAVKKLNDLFGVSPETQANSAQQAQISEGQLKNVLAQSQRLYAGVEKKLESAGAKPDDPAVKATKFLGGTAGTLLKFAALGPAGVSEMTTSSFIEKTYQGIDEDKGWVKSLLAGGSSASVAASVAAIPGGKEAYGAVWKLLAARGARGVGFGLGFGLSDAAIDKLIYDKKISAQELGDRIGSSIMNMVGLEGAGALPGIKPIVDARREASAYPSAEAARGDVIRQGGDVLNRYADLVGKAESPEAAMASPEAAAMRQEIQELRQKGQAIAYAEKAKIPWTGKTEIKEVTSAIQEPGAAPEVSRPGGRGEDLAQGGGGIRQGEQGQEAPREGEAQVRVQKDQAKAEEVVNPENSVSYDDLPRERKMEIAGSIENELQGYMDDPASFQRAYTENPKSRGGRIVNGDIGYDLIPTIARDQVSGRAALKDVDSGVLSYMMTLMRGVRAAAIEAAGDRPVGITAGSQASGKTELANKLIENGTLGAVIDAPHNDVATLDHLAKEIRSRGKEVELFFVDRANFGETFKSMIRRAIKEGRTVPLSEMVHNRDAVPNAVLKFGEVNRGLADTGVNHVRSLESPKGERPRYEGYGGRLFENIPWDMRPEDIPVSGQDALESIRKRTGEGRENLEKQALDAYTDYLEGVARGDEPAIPSDIRKELEADLRGNLPSEQTIPRRHERPDRGIPERDGRSVLAGQSGTAEGLSGAPSPEQRLATTGAVTPPLAPRASAPPVPAAPAQPVGRGGLVSEGARETKNQESSATTLGEEPKNATPSAPKRTEDIASAIFGGTQVPKVDTEAVRNSVREVFPGKDDTSKAIRHALYKREGFLRSNPTPEEILAAGEQIRNNPLLRRRKEAGAIDLPDVDVAMDGVVKRLFPDRDAADPPLTQEQVIQKARDAAKKQTPPIDLSKVDLNEGINGVLADWYLKAHGAGIGEDGVPIIGGSLFPAEKAAMPTRDATAIEHSMRLIDNPAALWEGGVDTLKDPLFRPGTSPVADAAFANSRAMILKQNLVDWTQTLLAPILDHSKEVEKAVAPIFDRYMRKRAQQMALEKQLGRRLEIRALERDRSKLDAKFRKATQEQVRDIVPPTGVEGESQTESRDHRKGSRAATIIGLKTKIDEIDKKIAKIKKDKKGMPILDNPSATMAKYELLETQLERDRKALDATTARLGTKFGDVRIAVAASVGARPDAYPEWLTASIRPHEQRIAELTRKFYDDAALPAMEREGIPGRPWENFLHQPTSRLVSAAKGKLGAIIDSKRPEHYMEASMNPESIRFHHKEDNALLWFPSVHASLGSYVDTFPSILAKRELANRWDKAVTEMRAGGQPRLAGDVEEFLNNYLHGAKRHAVIDAMMGWFYWKNLALNPSPALLHAVKQFLNWAEIGPIATMKGYKNVAQQVVPGEGGRLRREGFKTWMGAKGGVAAIEQGAGIEAPFSKGGAVRKGLRKLGAAPIGQVEAIDRNVTFMGALEMAKAQGLSNEQALQVAMGSTLAINFLGVDRAAMYRGSVGNAVFAFMGAPTKLTDFGRRRAMDVLREFVKASRGIKSGEGVRGFTPRTGKPWLPKGGPEGESWRKMQASATYAITIAMAGYLGKELFNTNRLQQGILHLPKLLKVVGAFVTGDTEHIYGATADLAPAITQAMDNIEKYGLGMGLVHTAMPTVLDKALRGSPNRKKQPQWGGPDRERATRYLLGTPKADVQERMDRKAAFKKAMQQKRNRETWKREHSWLKRQLSEVVD